MLQRPSFKTHLTAQVVETEGVVVLSEHGHTLLRGQLYAALAPLLDGERTLDQITEALAEIAPPAEVLYAVFRLERRGLLAEPVTELPPERTAFWQAAGLDPLTAERRLSASSVSVTSVGTPGITAVDNGLRALGVMAPVKPGEAATLAIVLTDDYLQDGLDAFNRQALQDGRSWLLAKTVGSILWIGPLFRPGRGPCWECLATRLRANREVEQYLLGRAGQPALVPVVRGRLPSSEGLAGRLIALEAVRALAADACSGAEPSLTTIDLTTLATTLHAVVPRPQCVRCGALDIRPNRPPTPPQLDAPAAADPAEPHTLEATFDRYRRHISPITGAITHLVLAPPEERPYGYLYYAGHSQDGRRDSLFNLRRWLGRNSGGRGFTDLQAKVSGLCEGLERLAGRYHGDEIRHRASYRDLQEDAIHPNACMLFSQTQYRERAAWNALDSRFCQVPEPFDDDQPRDWSPVWSVRHRRFIYLPSELLYYGYPRGGAARACLADSSGAAAGPTLVAAVVSGFLELVERDAVSLWWYNRARRPALDLDSFDDPYVQDLRRHFRQRDRDVWALDLTADARTPVFVVVSRLAGAQSERIMFGFAAHFDPRRALLSALSEMAQTALSTTGLEDGQPHPSDDPVQRRWWQTATIASQPHLAPSGSPARTYRELNANNHQERGADPMLDLERCQQIVSLLGLDLLVLEQTRPDIGLPVARVLVPGLRPHYARFAPGRLYDVPVTLGWQNRSLLEAELNPIPMFS